MREVNFKIACGATNYFAVAHTLPDRCKLSQDIVALLDGFTDVKLITPTDIIDVITNAPTLEDAIAALLQAAPPSSVKVVFVRTMSLLIDRQSLVTAAQKAGYTNIEAIELASLSTSYKILNLPLNCAVGEHVLVVTGLEFTFPWYKCYVHVIRKCENAWQLVGVGLSPLAALAQYPSARNYVVYEGTTEVDKAVVVQFFGDRNLHFSSMMKSDFYIKYIWNRINNGNLNGYEVLPSFLFDLHIKVGDRCDRTALTDQVPPFTITKVIDVGDAPTVEIHVDRVGQGMLVKTFKFKSAAFRTVLITLNVDKTLLPQVTLKTIATRLSVVEGNF
uniref:KR domain-containing protein n=1 Tax=Panagrellus redivivus TaxID=6233 RepID=A0A7E4W313_PANRE